MLLCFFPLNTSGVLDNNWMACCVENGGFETLWSRLTNLEYLDLGASKDLNGSIISSLVGFSSLRTLHLSSIRFESVTTRIIQELNQITSLKELVLSYNWFQSFGSVKAGGEWLRLRNLEVLDLSNNLLNNSVLSSLRELWSLKVLYLRYNKLEGSVPGEDLYALNSLQELDISENDVDNFSSPQGIKTSSKFRVLHLDKIPSSSTNLLRSLGAFISLQTLYLRQYNLQGIVTDLQNLSKIEVLFLDQAFVDKNFLESIGAMTSLKVLSLRACKLNGTLPPEGFCKLKKLEELDLSKNNFEGILPSCLGNLSSLRVLDIGGNHFHGNIASSPLANLHSLEYLSISDNMFQLPDSFKSFANHSSLKVFFGDSNELVRESIYEIYPRFQLKVFSLSNCTSKSKDLVTKLPNFLFHQHDLRILDLSFNNFGGLFPVWLFQNNTRLKAIYLRENRYVGSLQLPAHPNPYITMLDFSNMKIPGLIPANFSSVFPNVERLNMSTNTLEGDIPPSFGNLKSLQVLDLSGNNLSGALPGSLAMGCFSLWFLKLSNNNLKGEISPASLNFVDLIYLYMANNNFVGNISDIPTLTHLAALDLSSNYLSGNLPRSMMSMQGLSLSNNHFDGSIPLDFCQFEFLEYLDLSENNLSGSIPSCLGHPYLIHIYLNKNKLSGPLTGAFHYSNELVTLDLSDNNLTGTIPSWLSRSPDLSVVLLRANHFGGDIPIQLCQLPMLSLVDLSGNDLSGPIPPCFSNITFKATTLKTSLFNLLDSMYSIKSETAFEYIGNTKLQGRDNFFYITDAKNAYFFVCIDLVGQVEFRMKTRLDSYMRGNLILMSGIDLSCNKLTGEIPPDMGNLSLIYALNLSHNNLIGSIRTTFSKLSQIESLDLSYNYLEGSIPSELTELNFLAIFSVAHNNLSGPVPDRTGQFATFEESSYEGNPLLCGPPLHNSCTKTPDKPNGKGQEQDGWIDINVFYVSFVVNYMAMLLGIAAVLYINPNWRRAWFYLVEQCINTCYHFAFDIFSKLFNFRNV